MPAFLTTNALGISPASGCGFPITAASATMGCSSRSDSVSIAFGIAYGYGVF